MAGAQIPTGITILNSYLGYFGISLTNFATSASTAIASGSKIEVASAFFTFSSDDTPDATSWTNITTATTAYLALVPSGTAGSQILTSSWTSTAPTWSTSKQGWYASSGSSTRIVASVYKTSSTKYDNKTLLSTFQSENLHGKKTFLSNGTWTAPQGITQVYLTGAGKGGNGYQGNNTISGGGGGSGGGGAGFCIDYPVTVTPFQTYTVLVGDASSGTSFDTVLYLGNGVSATSYTVGGSAGTCTPTADNVYLFNGGAGGRGGTNGTSSLFQAEHGANTTVMCSKGGYGAQPIMQYVSAGATAVMLSGGGGGGASYGGGGDGASWHNASGSTAVFVGLPMAGAFGGGGGGGSSNYFATTGSAYYSNGASGGNGFLRIEW